jgi:hypothetical protein
MPFHTPYSFKGDIMQIAAIPRFPSHSPVSLPCADDLTLVLPTRLLAQISGHMARHMDGRETGLQLFGAIIPTPCRTLLVPLAVLGGGLDAVRREESFFADIAQKELYLASLRACYPGPRASRWSELGNVHLHPESYGILPSPGDLRSAAEALHDIADPRPAWVVGIAHPSGNSTRLAFFGVQGVPDRPKLVVIPWEARPLPTLTDPDGPPFHATLSPFRTRALLRALAARGETVAHRCDPDGGYSINAGGIIYRLKGAPA